MIIRFATIEDLESIIDIYNQAIRAGNATADIEVLHPDDRMEWFHEHSEDSYPIYIVEEGGVITGWGSLSHYRKGRGGLRTTAEISFYIHYDHQGKGYGRKLIEYMIDDCPRLGINNLIALLLDINDASIAILKKYGFSQWGLMPDIVELNGVTCGHLFYGRKIER